jgi:hypothetical protein
MNRLKRAEAEVALRSECGLVPKAGRFTKVELQLMIGFVRTLRITIPPKVILTCGTEGEKHGS